MSKSELQIDDLDADLLAITYSRMREIDQQLLNIAKERDKYASVSQRHLLRLATEKGLEIALYDFDLGLKQFVLKPVPQVDPTIPVE